MWQRVIHGGAMALRKEVARVLRECAPPARAERYLMCGLGDRLVLKDGGAHVAPRGCGDKLCPRCGRKRGGRYARRILQWLAAEPHAELWMVCLTQRVRAGEPLHAARSRMAPKQRAFMRWLTGRGMTAAMTTVHATWSPSCEGWHYHVHVFAELPVGCEHEAGLLHKWAAIDGDAHVDPEGRQCRLVLGAGQALAELRDDGGAVDFWHESSSAVARAVQYPVRDMAQGVAAWRLGGDDAGLRRCATELVRDTRGWKMFRAWGKWRKAAPAVAPVVAKEASAEKSAAPATGAMTLGTVGRVWVRARRGDAECREAMRLLEGSCRNQSDFAKRFVKFCRLGWNPSG